MTGKRDVVQIIAKHMRESRHHSIIRRNASGLDPATVAPVTASSTFLATIILTIGLTACAAPVKKDHFSLDQLPVHFAYSPQQPIGPELYPDQQAALVGGVTSQADTKGYRILDQRIFVYVGHVREIGPQWVVLHADLWTEFNDNYRAKEIAKQTGGEEPSASAVWRLPGGDLIEVAQSQTSPDGTALVGYFSLAK
jgi:hypothetical protein